MPLGNSITKGISGSEDDIGYRRGLYLALIDAGYAIDFVGTQFHGIPDDFDRDHEGHGGWEADEIRDSIYNWLVINPADVILLHIGTNDVSHNHIDVSEVEGILDNIDQWETDYGNHIKVFLARIILRNDNKNPQTIIFNDSVEALAEDRIDAGDDIVIVDMQNALTYPDDLNDNVHPNQSGYDKMAVTWFNHLFGTIPPASCPDGISHYWKFDGDSSEALSDRWGGTYTFCGNCPVQETGIAGEAFRFDGINDAIVVMDDNTCDWSATAGFSIEMWLRVDSLPVEVSDDCMRVAFGRPGGSLGDSTGLESLAIGVVCDTSSNFGRLKFDLRDRTGGATVVGTTMIVDSNWHHVVAVRDSSALANRLYLDGSEVATTFYGYTEGFNALTALQIGNLMFAQNALPFIGHIDELATYNRALTDEQIQVHYLSGLSGFGYCQGAIAPEITSTPRLEVQVDDYYTYDVEALGDPDPLFELIDFPGGMTIDSATGLAQWQAGQAGNFEVELQAYNAVGADTQSFTISVSEPPPCPEGMSHYWPLDEDSPGEYRDIYASADAICFTCPDETEGLISNAQQFGGESGGQAVNIADDGSLNWHRDSSFTVEFWVKQCQACGGSTNSYNGVIVGRYDSSGPDDLNLWWVGVNCLSDYTQGGIRFVLREDATEGLLIVSADSISDGDWHHAVSIWEGTKDSAFVYIDGELQAQTGYNFQTTFSSPMPVNVGYLDFGGGFRFSGALDELAIYDRALSVAEIELHYQNGLAGIAYCAVTCGDVDGSGNVNVSDQVFLISYVFGDGPAPLQLETGDVDCNGTVNVSDIVYLIEFVFGDGNGPCDLDGDGDPDC
jgi:lysophospholipase L1-like esterase